MATMEPLANSAATDQGVVSVKPQLQNVTADVSEESVDDEVVTDKLLLDLWDALTHCAEPKNSDHVVAALKEMSGLPASDEDEGKFTNPGALGPIGREIADGYYRLRDLSKQAGPKPHRSWKPSFVIKKGEDKDDEGGDRHYFQVFRNEIEANTILIGDTKSQSFALPETISTWYDENGNDVEERHTHILFRFGRKYDMNIQKDKIYPRQDISKYNYAEHKRLGDNLWLKFPNDERKRAAERRLGLKNGLSLTYGEINGLGGDFFATQEPICMGGNIEEQRRRFVNAYQTLAVSQAGKTEAEAITENRSGEVAAVDKAIEDGTSTTDAYKSLVVPVKLPGSLGSGVNLPGISQEEVDLTRITQDRGALPNYLDMAQLNFDHFGEDGKTAYKAGHMEALAAAVAGDLDLAYSMNAFADHFLGDCFASGHVRTPRRILHGADGQAVHNAIQSVMKWVDGKGRLEPLAGALTAPQSVLKAIAPMAPDLCSKYMHDEDNHLGLWVRNPRGDKWKMYGDKKLYDKGNAVNEKLMKECLQISIDEVYEAFEARAMTRSPEQFGAWQIVPSEVVMEGPVYSHAPLFNEHGQYRKDLFNIWCREYQDIKESWVTWDQPKPGFWGRLASWVPNVNWKGHVWVLKEMAGSTYLDGLSNGS